MIKTNITLNRHFKKQYLIDLLATLQITLGNKDENLASLKHYLEQHGKQLGLVLFKTSQAGPIFCAPLILAKDPASVPETIHQIKTSLREGLEVKYNSELKIPGLPTNIDLVNKILKTPTAYRDYIMSSDDEAYLSPEEQLTVMETASSSTIKKPVAAEELARDDESF